MLGEHPAQLEGWTSSSRWWQGAGPAPVVQCRVDAADGTFEIQSRNGMGAAEGTLHARGA